MSGKVTDINNLERLINEFRIIKKSVVVLGPLGAEGDDELAKIISTNEFGTKDGRIPPRPAIRNSFDSKKFRKILISWIGQSVRDMFKGKINEEELLERAGLKMKSLIQRKIRSYDFKENAASTIQQKGSDNPLIDTSRYVQSIDYRVEKR